MAKYTERWISDLQDVMQYLDDLKIDERKRSTLRRACSESLVEAENRLQSDYESRHSGRPFSADDIKIMTDCLESSEPCKSWEEETLTLATLTQRLGRPPRVIKKKAIELGFGKKIDYWINRVK